MKLKSIFALLLIFIAAGTHAQNIVNVFINGTKSGQYVINDNQTDGGIWYKKKIYKNMERLSIEVKGKNITATAFKRSVNITDENQQSLFIAAETPGIPGQFILTNKEVLKRLAKGKMVKLYLTLDPANDKMLAPSRMIFIGNLSSR